MEITIVPSREIVIEGALLHRRARLRKWHILILVTFLVGVAAENGFKGFQFKELGSIGMLLGLYVGIMIYYRWRFLQKVRQMVDGTGGRKIKHTFTPSALVLSSDVVEESLPWSKVNRIIASPRVLVLGSKQIIVPLPVSDISEEIKTLLRAAIKVNRIKVCGQDAKNLLA